MPYSFTSPTIISKNNRPQLDRGSPGAEGSISALVQVIQRWTDEKIRLADAVAAARVHTDHLQTVYLEKKPEIDLSRLSELGYTFYTV